jgi:hypothetical protein
VEGAAHHGQDPEQEQSHGERADREAGPDASAKQIREEEVSVLH